MGRDCHGGDGGGGDGAMSSSKSKKKANAANGCMAAFYHLFDFQHFYFPSHHNLTIDSPSSSKGLKLIQESPPSTTNKDQKSLNIPVRMRVRTETGTRSSRLRALTNDTSTSTSSSEICSDSPGSKTPSLVARLMGLDLLPDQSDLNHSLSDLHTTTSRFTRHRLPKKGTRLGTRSLPESPRISSARKSDFDIHRLSLQLNKENSKQDEFGCPRLKLMRQDQEENRSPRDYARQIVKQIKERVVTRRVVGMDITKSVKNREGGAAQNSNEMRRDTTVSCSPRTRFSDKENKPSTVQKPISPSSFRPEQTTQKPKPKPKPTTVILVSVSKGSGEKQKQNKKRVKQRELRPINQCNKAESETRFSPRPMKSSPTPDFRNKKREAFLSESTDAKATNLLRRKKFKNITKSHNISATGPPQKQINETILVGLKSNEQASIFSSPMHKTEKNSPKVAMYCKLDDAATVSSSSSITLEANRIDSEQNYITRIMKLLGINSDSPFPSAATMLDLSIFRELEHSGETQSGSLALRCNRRLLFDLVNEILTKLRRRNHHGSELIGELCSSVTRCRNKRCPTPGEMASTEFDRLLETTKKLEEEGEEEIVAEIERDIVDALVGETASELSLNRRRMKTSSYGKQSVIR